MGEKLKFEEIADEFSKTVGQTSISRCDYVLIKDREVLFIELTKFKGKDLYNPKRYSDEVIENVKKMWGSLTVLTWYLSENACLDKMRGKKKVYLLMVENYEDKHSRAISNMLKALQKYKNGGFDEIAFKRF